MRVMAVLAGSMLMTAGAAVAQTGTCTLREDPQRTVNIANRGTEFETWYITNAVLDCDGGRHLVAQNATYSVSAGQVTLTGAVQVEDPERTLTSAFAQYYTESRQLHARTNVVLTEKASGSVITSELLDAYEESPQRPEGLVIATGGSPRAILYQQEETGARDSTIMDAREIRIEGESFRGTGDAVLRRDSLTATGQTIDYSQQTRQLDVMVGARVQLPTQELRGDSITATIDEQDEIRDVLARRGAELHAEDLDVTAPAIRLLFENGGVSRLVAMPWASDPAVAQPRVVSEQFTMNADSIDVLAPDQQVTAAVAIGNARGERFLPDSLRALLPEAEPEVLALLGADWMRGDTVRARFAPNPAAETDTTAAATVIEQLAAVGDQAQSMYSVRDETDPVARLSFNYLRSSYIEVNFADGAVSTVYAAGDARGVYLQPADAARATTTVGAATPGRRR
ncbi:MAG TPA: hypothetical protein VFZ69_13355 [Longimicrobiales bacterium]